MLLFLKVFFTEFIAEMGDKTQLMLIALTSKYKLRDIILGTAAAILVLNGLAVLAGGLVSEFIPDWLIKTIAALAFLYFAASTIAGDDDDEEEGSGKSKIKFAPLAVFCTFFIAELGDKTQLTAITFGANEGMSAALVVWIGCSLGLFAADILGMLVGYLLKSKGVLKGDVLQTLDLYFKLCSLSVNARSLSELGLLLANGGISTTTGKRLLDKKVVRTLKTLMLTCGMYDRSGEFAVRVGIPSKSGVGGGILSCVGGRMGIGIYGPALDEKGNSIGGGYTLEYLSEHLNLHILDSADAKEA